jgi:hypothetical protein
MGCGCGGAKTVANVQKYTITGDPESKEYLTEHEALVAATTRGLTGKVVPVR